MIAWRPRQRSQEIPANLPREKEGDFPTVSIDQTIYLAESDF
jgi:hypothetical protein